MALSAVWHMLTSKCNDLFLPGSLQDVCLKFFIDKFFVGLVHPSFREHLLKYPDVFSLDLEKDSNRECIRLNPKYSSFAERTAAVELIMRDLRDSHQLSALSAWRNEHYGVFACGRTHALMSIERSAARILGTNRHNVHINGYTYLTEGSYSTSNYNYPWTSDFLADSNINSDLVLSNAPENLRMWVAKRSQSRPQWPGLLDNLAAGGLTYGIQALECAKKESMEEAGISDDYLEALKPGGSVSFACGSSQGVGASVAFCYDLELPSTFFPRNIDGEVASFYLVSLPEVAKLITTDLFKPSSALIVLDFLMRNGYVDPDKNTMYEKWSQWMHAKLPFD